MWWPSVTKLHSGHTTKWFINNKLDNLDRTIYNLALLIEFRPKSKIHLKAKPNTECGKMKTAKRWNAHNIKMHLKQKPSSPHKTWNQNYKKNPMVSTQAMSLMEPSRELKNTFTHWSPLNCKNYENRSGTWPWHPLTQLIIVNNNCHYYAIVGSKRSRVGYWVLCIWILQLIQLWRQCRIKRRW